jgi:hypothetical protein
MFCIFCSLSKHPDRVSRKMAGFEGGAPGNHFVIKLKTDNPSLYYDTHFCPQLIVTTTVATPDEKFSAANPSGS